VQQDADKNNQTNVLIVLECSEATGGLPVAGKPLVVGHESGRTGN
jgi:hypothetical protein